MCSSKWIVAAIAALSLITGVSNEAAATQPTCSITSIKLNSQTFLGNPGQGSSGNQSYSGSVSANNPVQVTGATNTSTSGPSSCTHAGSSTSLGSSDGTLTANQYTGQECPAPANALGNLFTTSTLSYTPTASGYISFLNNFVPTGGSGYSPSQSPCVTMQVNNNSCGDFSNEVRLDTPSAAEVGDNEWSYKFVVQNCTPATITDVKLQGGTGGWLSTTCPSDTDTSGLTTGSAPPSPQCNIVGNGRKSNGATVITWDIGSMNPGDWVSLTVTVSGDPKTPGTYPISGNWSAAYIDTDPSYATDPDCYNASAGTYSTTCKSAYTDIVSITYP